MTCTAHDLLQVADQHGIRAGLSEFAGALSVRLIAPGNATRWTYVWFLTDGLVQDMDRPGILWRTRDGFEHAVTPGVSPLRLLRHVMDSL